MLIGSRFVRVAEFIRRFASLPVSAITELTAVTPFGLNMAITLLLPPPTAAVRKPVVLPVLSQAL
jgi:hypothetical protein